MKKTSIISTISMVAASILLVGCIQGKTASVYSPAKAKAPSSEVSGTTLTIKYDIDNEDRIYYYIYDAAGNKIISDWLMHLDMETVMDMTERSVILGTIGDKVVVAWANGAGPNVPSLLSVHDFSEKKTYHLIQDEPFSILKKGNSYVVETKNKAISLNSGKEVSKKSLVGYHKLSLGRAYSALNGNAYREGTRKTSFTPIDAYDRINSFPENRRNKTLNPLMFGKNKSLTKAYIHPNAQ